MTRTLCQARSDEFVGHGQRGKDVRRERVDLEDRHHCTDVLFSNCAFFVTVCDDLSGRC